MRPIIFACALAVAALCQGLALGQVQVLERGYNHATVQRTRQVPAPSGGFQTVTDQWTRLEDGLNYWDENLPGWAEAEARIELIPGGAVALHGQHRAIFSSNVNDPAGALDLEIRHQIRLRSSVLAIGYFDALSGNEVFIATVHDASGEWIAPNQIIYRDAFDGLNADVVYTYRKSGVEADVVLREIPPSPAEYRLVPETSRLQVYTEFFDPPQPTKRTRVLSRIDDPETRARVAEPDWPDEELDFGPNHIGDGRAFAWSARDATQERPELFAPVGKKWSRTPDGRTVLTESVEYVSLLDDLVALGQPNQRLRDLQSMRAAWAQGLHPHSIQSILRNTKAEPRGPTQARLLPPRPRSPENDSRAVLTASLGYLRQRPGVVIDWTSVSSGSSNFTFYPDRTYYVSGMCVLNGTTVVEGGTVVKFPRYTNTVNYITITGPFDCRTGPYRPAVFTAETDNTVGETVLPGTPYWNDNYAGFPLRFTSTGTSIDVHDVRIKHSAYGVAFVGTGPYRAVRNSQFLACRIPIYSATDNPIHVQNVLIDNCKVLSFAFFGTNTPIIAEHLTIRNCASLLTNVNLSLTNSLLVCVTNVQTYSGAGNFATSVATGIFQPVGGGNAYLATSSPHRNSGVSGIDPSLKAQLAKMTTFAPATLSGQITNNMTLTPQANRDTDQPDRGYHYWPLDYCVSGLTVTNCTLELAEGLALGVYGATGLTLCGNAALHGQGLASSLTRLVRFNAVQESGTNWATSGGPFTMLSFANPGGACPSVDLRFTEIVQLGFSADSSTTLHTFLDAGETSPQLQHLVASLCLQDCLLLGSTTLVADPQSAATAQSITLNNCLFERCYTSISNTTHAAVISLSMHNCMVRGGAITFANADTSGDFTIADNLFDTGTATLVGAGSASASHNAFTSAAAWGGIGTLSGVQPDYQTGPNGSYYYPTSGSGLVTLIDAGSRSASEAGLYHYTTLANQQREGASTVDIGFHYVASSPSPQALIAHWRLDEVGGTTATDSSGNGFHGQLSNGPLWSLGGRTGGCLSFDGINDIVTVVDAPLLEVGRQNADFSLAMWVKLEQGYTGYYRSIFHKGNSSSARTPSLFLRPDSDRIHFRVSTTGDWNQGGDTVGALPLHTWTHVAVAKSGLHLRLYLDGVLDSDVLLPPSVIHNTDSIYFGDDPWMPPFSGFLDEIQLFARALSPAEIGTLALGLPTDTDGDGVPDYLEDANGNGLADNGENSWDSGFLSYPGLSVFTPFK